MRLALHLVFALLPFTLLAQPGYFNIQFDRRHQWEAAFDVIETENAYLIAGVTGAPTSNDTGLVLVVSKNDLTVTEHQLAYFTGTKIRAIAKSGSSDHPNFIVHSRYYENTPDPANSDLFLAKCNENFDTLAFQTSGLPQEAEYTLDLDMGPDGSIGLTGYTYGVGAGKLLVAKYDSTLHPVFLKTYTKDPLYNHFGNGLTQAPDGGLVVVGNRFLNSVNSNGFIARVNASGALLWWQEIPWEGDVQQVYLQDVIGKSDGTYLAVGIKVYDPIVGGDHQHYWAICFDDNGQILWSKEYGDNDWTGWLHIAHCSDGNYAMCGYEKDQPANLGHHKQYGVISKITPDGNLLWHRKYTMSAENKRYDVFYGFTPTSDGGFIGVGTVWGDSLAKENIWIVKFDSLGCIQPGCNTMLDAIDLPVAAANPIRLFPNPTNGPLHLQTTAEQPVAQVWIYNEQGQPVWGWSNPPARQLSIDLSRLPAGIYHCAALVNGVWSARQVVKE